MPADAPTRVLFPREGKLIRDKVPQRMEADRQTARMRILTTQEFGRHLAMKIREESTELLMAHVKNDRAAMIEEAGDVQEAFETFLKSQRISPAEVAQARLAKARTHGRFRKRILLEAIEDPPKK